MATRARGVVRVALIGLAAALAACGEDDPVRSDRIPPAAVSNLSVAEARRTSILLQWTATGDDGADGTARFYDLRYTLAPWGEDSWEDASRASGLPAPGESGRRETYLLDSLDSGRTYWIALQAVDDAENRSPLSNLLEASTVPPEGDDRSWWDGFADQGMNEAVYAFARFGGSVVAAGAFTRAGGLPARHVAAWDGSTWSPLGTGTDYEVMSLLEFDGGLVAGGAFLHAGDVPARHVASWDGAAWGPLGEGMNNHVLALAEWDGSLVAGGLFTQADGAPAAYLARWREGRWEAIAGLDGQVYALASFQGDLIAGGRFARAGGEPVHGIARWDGEAWHDLAGGLFDSPSRPRVSALFDLAGTLAVGGYFREAGDLPVRNLAVWDGAAWSRLGEGMDDAVRAFAEFGGLVAGGSFTSTGDGPTRGAARWDGDRWLPLASGLGGGFVTVHALLAHEGSLYVGGLFETAGGTASGNVARWDDPSGPSGPPPAAPPVP